MTSWVEKKIQRIDDFLVRICTVGVNFTECATRRCVAERTLGLVLLVFGTELVLIRQN